MKRWFLTVDWCKQGKRGIFCDIHGHAFSKETQHTQGEMFNILNVFSAILHPESVELTEDDVRKYSLFHPLAEYSNQYGYVVRGGN